MALRFAKAYHKSIKTRGFSNKIITTVEFPEDFERRDIQDMVLIPGGRFLLITQPETTSLWDPNSPKNGPSTSFSLGHQAGVDDVSCVHISCDKIRILLSSSENIPNARMFHDEFTITWKVLEITHLGGNVFMSEVLYRLNIIYPWGRYSTWICFENAMYEDKVLFLTSSGRYILMWDFVQNSYFGGSKVNAEMRPCQTFLGQGHIMCVGEEGVRGFRLPSTLRQVEDAIFLDLLPETLSPSISLLYHREYNKGRPGLGTVNILGLSSNGDYTLFHHESSLTLDGCDALYLHRYRFTVNDAGPATSTLVLQESMKRTIVAPEGTFEFEPLRLQTQTYNGRSGTIWAGRFHEQRPPTYLISVHPPSTAPSSVPTGSLRAGPQISELHLVPFTELADLTFCSFCSTSGKVAVFRNQWENHTETEGFVQLYHLL